MRVIKSELRYIKLQLRVIKSELRDIKSQLGHSMKMSIFLSLAFTEILHLKKHFRVTISLHFKIKQYVIWTITPSWAINVAIFDFYKFYRIPSTTEVLTVIYRGKVLYFEANNRFLHHLKYNNVYITIKYRMYSTVQKS